MGYLRHNFLPLLVGLAATLVGTAAVVVIMDTVVVDDTPARVFRAGAFEIDLDRIDGDLREFAERALRERLGDAASEAVAGFGPALGVTVEDHDGAIVVQRVLAGSAAARAGVAVGDEIRRVDGERVESVDALREALAEVELGEDYELEVRRDGKRLTLDVERRAFVAAGIESLRGLFERPPGLERPAQPAEAAPPQRRSDRQPLPAAGAPSLGVTVVPANTGLRVASVLRGSGADAASMRPGDMITRAAGHQIVSVDQLQELLAGFEPGDVVAVTVRRNEGAVNLRVRLGPPAELARSLQLPRPDGERDPLSAAVPRLDAPTFDALVDRLADLIAERLRAATVDGANAVPRPVPAPRPEVATAPLAELTVYFGRVAAISDGSLTLTGSGGAITLAITDRTERVGALPAAIGDLVTVLAGEGTVRLLIVVG